MPPRGHRRDLLADAAIEVLAQEGGRGLTHRAVDREAGFPQGTTKNYCPSRDALFSAVARRMTEQHAEAVRQLREHTPTGISLDDVTSLYAAMLRRIGTTGRSQFLALFELHLEAVRRPEVRAALGEMALGNVESARFLHGVAGGELGGRGAGLLDAGMLGVAMSLLSLPADVLRTIGFDDTEQLSASLLDMAGTAPDTDTTADRAS